MTHRPNFSIVIPSFNCADLVDKAVESAYDFTKGTPEVIVVDDGSTDNSKEVFAALKMRFPDLVVIHQANGGLSCARNTGIRHAHGHFLVLLDADDQLLPIDTLDGLDVGVDMVRMGVEEVGLDNSVLFHVEKNDKMTGQEYLTSRFADQNFYTPSWAYIYRLDWLRSSELRFGEGLIHEDILFTVEALLHCQCMISVDNLGYRYYRRPGSITTAKSLAHTLRRIASLSTICSKLTIHVNNYPAVDLSRWVLHTIDYAASLAEQTRSRLARWRIFQMELAFFLANKVWPPHRTRRSIRFRIRRRLEDWLVVSSGNGPER